MHAGAIGKLISGESTCQCNLIFQGMDDDYKNKVGREVGIPAGGAQGLTRLHL